MEQKTDRLYPSSPFENIDLEQRSEKNLKVVKIFTVSNNDIKEMFTCFKDKNNKRKKN